MRNTKIFISVNHISVLYKFVAVETLVLHFGMATFGEDEMVAVMREKSSKSPKSPAGTGRLCMTSGSHWFKVF